jgi:hypothetical protein
VSQVLIDMTQDNPLSELSLLTYAVL